jgi:acyl dehydratase
MIYTTKSAKGLSDPVASQLNTQYSTLCDFSNLENYHVYDSITSTPDETWDYGILSGDINPIHMNGIAARLFGQKNGRISHGAMILGKALSFLENKGFILPNSFGVSFKGPMSCGSKIDVKLPADKKEDRENLNIDLEVVGNKRPNLCIRMYEKN